MAFSLSAIRPRSHFLARNPESTCSPHSCGPLLCGQRTGWPRSLLLVLPQALPRDQRQGSGSQEDALWPLAYFDQADEAAKVTWQLSPLPSGSFLGVVLQ